MSPRTSVKKGRRFLLGAFGLVLVADATLIAFAHVPYHPIPNLTAYVALAFVWTTASFISLWLRKGWARYLLLAALMLITLALILADLSILAMREKLVLGPLLSLLVASLLYPISALIIAFSANVLRLTSRAWE